MIIVGENSYVTIPEADEYLRFELGANKWAGMSNDVKTTALITAYRKIKTIRLVKHTPKEVKQWAQILEAWGMLDETNVTNADRVARGVKSVSIGKASESYDNTALNMQMAGTLLLSQRAYSILRPYIDRMAVIV